MAVTTGSQGVGTDLVSRRAASPLPGANRTEGNLTMPLIPLPGRRPERSRSPQCVLPAPGPSPVAQPSPYAVVIFVVVIVVVVWLLGHGFSADAALAVAAGAGGLAAAIVSWLAGRLPAAG